MSTFRKQPFLFGILKKESKKFGRSTEVRKLGKKSISRKKITKSRCGWRSAKKAIEGDAKTELYRQVCKAIDLDQNQSNYCRRHSLQQKRSIT